MQHEIELAEPYSHGKAWRARTRDGQAVVFKLGDADFETEVAALEVFDGRGAARLLRKDTDTRSLLLERIEPGTPLWHLEDDEEATRIAARVMRGLWRRPPAEHPFPTVADWGRGFARHRTAHGGGPGPLDRALFERAETVFETLLMTSDRPMLLHGDLHHGNIVQAGEDRWVAIDPKGVLGEPEYETGALMRNPLPDIAWVPYLPGVMQRRAAILAEELRQESERILAWGFAQAVLAAIWTLEDGGDWAPAIACASAMARAM